MNLFTRKASRVVRIGHSYLIAKKFELECTKEVVSRNGMRADALKMFELIISLPQGTQDYLKEFMTRP